MDSKEALERIKDAELKAQETIEAAKKEAHRILSEAGHEKERIIKLAQEKAGADIQKLKDNIKGLAEQESSLIRKQSQEEIEASKAKAASRVDRAAQFLKERLNL